MQDEQVVNKTPVKKKIKRAVSILLVVCLLIGTALAFLTSKDNSVNTFTIGNIRISLQEYFDSDYDGVLSSSELYKDGDSPSLTNIVASSSVGKTPWVTNTGINDAYIYMRIGIPAIQVPVTDVTGEATGETVDCEFLKIYDAAGNEGVNDGWTLASPNYVTEESDQDGMVYHYYTYYYDTSVAHGEDTAPLFSSVQYVDISEILPWTVVPYSTDDDVAIMSKVTNESYVFYNHTFPPTPDENGHALLYFHRLTQAPLETEDLEKINVVEFYNEEGYDDTADVSRKTIPYVYGSDIGTDTEQYKYLFETYCSDVLDTFGPDADYVLMVDQSENLSRTISAATATTPFTDWEGVYTSSKKKVTWYGNLIINVKKEYTNEAGTVIEPGIYSTRPLDDDGYSQRYLKIELRDYNQDILKNFDLKINAYGTQTNGLSSDGPSYVVFCNLFANQLNGNSAISSDKDLYIGDVYLPDAETISVESDISGYVKKYMLISSDLSQLDNMTVTIGNMDEIDTLSFDNTYISNIDDNIYTAGNFMRDAATYQEQDKATFTDRLTYLDQYTYTYTGNSPYYDIVSVGNDEIPELAHIISASYTDTDGTNYTQTGIYAPVYKDSEGNYYHYDYSFASDVSTEQVVNWVSSSSVPVIYSNGNTAQSESAESYTLTVTADGASADMIIYELGNYDLDDLYITQYKGWNTSIYTKYSLKESLCYYYQFMEDIQDSDILKALQDKYEADTSESIFEYWFDMQGEKTKSSLALEDYIPIILTDTNKEYFKRIINGTADYYGTNRLGSNADEVDAIFQSFTERFKDSDGNPCYEYITVFDLMNIAGCVESDGEYDISYEYEYYASQYTSHGTPVTKETDADTGDNIYTCDMGDEVMTLRYGTDKSGQKTFSQTMTEYNEDETVSNSIYMYLEEYGGFEYSEYMDYSYMTKQLCGNRIDLSEWDFTALTKSQSYLFETIVSAYGNGTADWDTNNLTEDQINQFKEWAEQYNTDIFIDISNWDFHQLGSSQTTEMQYILNQNGIDYSDWSFDDLTDEQLQILKSYTTLNSGNLTDAQKKIIERYIKNEFSSGCSVTFSETGVTATMSGVYNLYEMQGVDEDTSIKVTVNKTCIVPATRDGLYAIEGIYRTSAIYISNKEDD